MAAQEDLELTSFHRHTEAISSYREIPHKEELNDNKTAQQSLQEPHREELEGQRHVIYRNPIPNVMTCSREGYH